MLMLMRCSKTDDLLIQADKLKAIRYQTKNFYPMKHLFCQILELLITIIIFVTFHVVKLLSWPS